MRLIKSRADKKRVLCLIVLCILVLFLGVKFLMKKEFSFPLFGYKGEVRTTEKGKLQDNQAAQMLKEEENKSSLKRKKEWTDDMRIHNFPYIRLTDHMKKGDYIDVRISFSNGGDFVLLSKKRIEDIAFMDTEGTKGNSLWLNITEEELLRLSSAVVDSYIHEGCQIYAIQYVDSSQKGAIINYSVSSLVRQLMEDDPNIVKRAESVKEWSLWEEYKTEKEQQRRLLNSENRDEQSPIAEAYPEDDTGK